MKTWGLITGFTLTLLFYSLCCCVPDPVILHGDIGGYVTDADTNEPIKNATIRLDPSSDSTTTGDEGEYLFKKNTF